MPPWPGDPFIRPSDSHQELAMDPTTMTEAERHARKFINFTEDDLKTDSQELKLTVLYWKITAENLRSANVPLYVNRRNSEDIDPFLVNEAKGLDNFLDELIPLEGVHSDLLVQKLRILIAGAEDFEVFARQMKELDFSLKCNEIWENESIAYRCNTCALTPCMSLCAECFLSNGHAGHDFTRFFSREGGACDCGNIDVLHDTGFCDRHGPAAMSVQRSMPPVALAEYIYMKIIVRVFLRLRGFEKRYHNEPLLNRASLISNLLKVTNDSINFIQKCVNMGGPMRNAMTKILLDKKLYQYLSEGTSSDHVGEDLKKGKVGVNLDWRSIPSFEQDKMSLLDSDLLSAFSPEMADTSKFMKCETLLHEFLFWILRLHYPQNYINFILSMLSDLEYLDMMALRFFKWYPLSANIMKKLCWNVADNHNVIMQTDISQVASRIIHVSVQMLSSSALCARMNRECDLPLVSTVFRSAYYLLGEKSTLSECFLEADYNLVRNMRELPTDFRNANQSRVILSEESEVIIHHGYWFVMGDIQNIMSHTQLAVDTVMSKAFQTYLDIASLMQGMNMYWRIDSGDHAPHDNGDQAQRTFTMEYETLSITMFNFITAIMSDNNEDAAQHFFVHTLQALRKWIKDVARTPKDTDIIPMLDIRSCPAYSFTVHLPLHRHLSTAISHFTGMEKMKPLIYALREEEPILRLLMLHPLRIHAFRAEQHCGMWVRNGHQLRIHSMLYAQPHINTSFFQPDLDLIRFCAANVKAEWFICALVQSFHLDDYFSIEDLPDDFREDFRMEIGEDVPGRYSPDPSGTRQGFISQQKYNVLSGKKQITTAEETLKKALEEEGIQLEEGESGIATLKFVVDQVMLMKEEGTKQEDLEQWNEKKKDLNEKLTRITEKLRANQNLMKLVIALSEVQKRQDRIIKYDYSKISLEPGAIEISTRWRGDESMILRRAEWVDALIQNCFLLLAELIVIRVNCGATEQESMRMEMVHELATGKMKYSNIRQSITDKGGLKSSTNTDFALALADIADYHEPDEGNGHQLQQGGYTLKPHVWETEFDPVFAQMRAPLPGRAQESLIRAEKYELEKIPVSQRPASLWIPYRLYDPNLFRHEAVENINKVLFTDRFTQLAILTLETKRGGLPMLSDNTLQLMVYLISIAAHEGGNRGEPERVTIYARFNKVYKVQLLEKSFETSLLQSAYRLFMSHVIKKGNILETLEKIRSGAFYEERIVGSEVEYLGRFLSILATFDESCKFLVECEIRAQKELKKEEESKVDKDMEKKLAMKRKREAIMEMQKRKGAKLMEKHRESEGLSQAEVNAMDITNRQIAQYECPICGDIDVPSTLQNPLGMMANVISNNIADLRVVEGFKEPSLVEAIDGHVTFPIQKRFWDHLQEKDLGMLQLGLYTDIVQGPSLSTEIQTCGHTAHLECFKLYKQSQLDHHTDRAAAHVSCPLCRTPVDSIIPMRIDADFGTSDIGPLDSQKSFSEIKRSILSWKKHYTDQIEENNFNDHYGLKMDNLLDRMSPSNQNLRSKYDSQTNLLALIRSNLERNIIYRQTNIPERRKNGWTLPIVQIIPAAVFRTTTRNEDLCLGALRDLFVPEMVQVTRSISESSLPVAESSAQYFDMDEALMILKAGPARIAEIARQADGKYSAFVKKTGAPMPQNQKVETLLTSRSDVPLLVFDFRLLFVRIACYVVDNERLSNHDKLALLQSLAKRIVRAFGIRTAVVLLHRITPQLSQDIIQDEFNQLDDHDPVWFLKHVSEWYRDSPHMWKAVQSTLSSDEFSINEPCEVISQLKKSLEALNEYCTEFIYSTGLVSKHSDVSSALKDFTDFQPMVKHWIRFFSMALNTSRGSNENVSSTRM